MPLWPCESLQGTAQGWLARSAEHTTAGWLASSVLRIYLRRMGRRGGTGPSVSAAFLCALAHAPPVAAQTASASASKALSGVWDQLRQIWNAELLAIGGQSVTLGVLVTALIVFAVGVWAARRLSALIGRLLTRHAGVEASAVQAFETLAFYFLVVLFGLFALRTANVPLTAFTVAGGAIAIGVGFGSQNVVNNFISGLILMAERPIRVGDIVDVDGTYGRIERIGARSTRIKTFDNIHIVVPNSSFLEKNVINWTLSDNIIRTSVDVGVAYGSPTREVDRLVRRVLNEHGRILAKPPPQLLFTDFGDNALHFRAYFWLQMRDMMDRRRVESDVRFRIDHLFREARIEIAFPQRDVHLDVRAPLPVRLLTEEAAPEPAKRQTGEGGR